MRLGSLLRGWFGSAYGLLTGETVMKSLELEQYLAFLDAFRKVLIGLTVWQLKQEALF